MQIARAAALFSSLALFACGDDGGPRLIDSGIGNTDAPPKVCTPLTLGAGDITVDGPGNAPSESAGNRLGVYFEAGTIGADEVAVYMTVRHSTSVTAIPATVEISGDNTDYFACTTCVYAISFDAQGAVSKLFMAQSGTVAFTGEPVNDRHIMATVTNLRLQEFDFDQTTGDTVFNPLGDCATLDGAIEADNLPNDWTCDPGLYYAAVSSPASSCECACGVFDGDCRNPAATVDGCPTAGMGMCWPDADAGSKCIAPVTNDTCATAGTPAVGPASAGTNIQLTGNTIGAHRNYNAGLNAQTCTKYGQPGPDVVHAITLLASTAYTFTLNGLDAEADMSIALVGPGADTLCGDGTSANPVMNCVGGDDESYEGDEESFSYTTSATGAGTYYIIVDSYNRDDAGPYTITVAR